MDINNISVNEISYYNFLHTTEMAVITTSPSLAG